MIGSQGRDDLRLGPKLLGGYAPVDPNVLSDDGHDCSPFLLMGLSYRV